MTMISKRSSRVLGALAMLCCQALALNPSLDISQYAHTSWTVRDGFALGNIYAMAQTPDGYLWLGTEFGLFRFDGIRSTPWTPPAGQHLPDKNINSLLVGRDGAVWIGSFAGLAKWRDGKLSQAAEIGREFIASLYEDREGTVWAGIQGGTQRYGKLCAIRGGSTQCYGEDGAFGKAVWSLYEDSSGTLWAGADTGLWRLKPGPLKRFAAPATLIAVNNGNDGRLLAAIRGAGLLQLAGDKLTTYPIPSATSPNTPLRDREIDANRLLRDRDGGLWIGAVQRGLIHIHAGRTDVFTRADGLSGDVVLSMFEDHEGNIWVATTGGLDRFRELPVTTVSVKQGLSSDATQAVLAASDGSVWVGANDGLTRWKEGKARVFRKEDGLPEHKPHSLFEDERGGVWVSTRSALARFQDGRFVPVMPMRDGEVHSITSDRAGHLWLSAEQALLHVVEGRMAERIPWSAVGRKQQAKVVLAENGGVWLSFWVEGGVIYVKDGQVRASYTAANGLGKGLVPDLRLGRDGALWVATSEGGLSRLKDGHIATLTVGNGLPCNTIHWSVEDDDGALWLYAACGLVRVVRTELEAWIADPKRTLATSVWDAADGVRLRSLAASSYGPRVTKAKDGTLWFVTGEGIQVLNPRRLAVNTLPPPVRIEEVKAGGKSYWDISRAEPLAEVRLPPRVHNLEIAFTALSLVAPEKAHFKYKLEGQDADWREMFRERRVQYTNLGPGPYRFRVIASNNSGVWNDSGDSLALSIDPAYYQTNWFRALGAAMFLVMLSAAYVFRIRQIEREARKLRDIIETIPAMAWTARPDGTNAFVNRRWAEATGLSAEETAGSGWRAVVHPDDLQTYSEQWSTSLASGAPFECEARFRFASGEYRRLLARGVPLRDAHGKIVRWHGVLTDIEDRRRAEDTLRESEARFRTFVDHVGDTIMVQDEAGVIVDVNHQGCENLGYARHEVVGAPPSASFCLDVGREANEMESVEKRTAAGEPVFDRHWHRRKDGTVFPVEVHSSLFTYGGRRFLLKAVRDISESLRAEEAVRQSEAQLRKVIDTIPAFVWSSMPDGSIDFINRRFLEFSGLSFEEALGHGWEAALHAEDRGRFIEEMRPAATGEPLETEARFRRADGQYRWLLFRSVPLSDERGAIVKWYGTSTDIDDRKRAEQALRRSEAYLSEAERLTHTGTFASDPSVTPLYWSEEMFRMFGFDPEDGLPPLDVALQRIHPEDLDKFLRAFERAIVQKLDTDVEYRALLPDRSVRHLYGLGHPVLNAEGELIEVVGTTIDITERKQAEQERERLRELEADLAHINRVSMMGELAASIAHEINQPLAGIVSNGSACLRWLSVTPPDIGEVREAIRDIVRDGKRAGEIIARIRALTKRAAMPSERIDLNEIIREVLALAGDEVKKKGAVVRTHFAKRMAPVLGDRVQLQQVVLNLIMNAVEAMSSVEDRRRELVVTTQNMNAGQVLVSVEDSGPGLAPDTAAKMFEPFFTTKASGMGMGLSISRSILQSHGGRLWATGKESPGAVFHFSLPIDQEQGTKAAVGE